MRPILEAHFPQLRYSAALIGSGSEVLGFDTPMSTDHHWGPRCLLFVDERSFELRGEISTILSQHLPYEFYGYSTHYSPPDLDDNGVQHLEAIGEGVVNHRVEIFTLRTFVQDRLAFDVVGEIETADWLTFSQQRLLEITRGAVFHDNLGLEDLRARFAFYPDAIWRYMLASGWARIGQEESFVGRTDMVGDDVGSQILTARLCRDVIRLAFLMERQYAPYAKWFGTAFAQLECAPRLLPTLNAAMSGRTWREREHHLANAYENIAAIHNVLEITEPIPAKVSPFFSRPFQVIHGGHFASVLQATLPPTLQCLPLIGSIDQFSDSTDLLENAVLRLPLKALYSNT